MSTARHPALRATPWIALALSTVLSACGTVVAAGPDAAHGDDADASPDAAPQPPADATPPTDGDAGPAADGAPTDPRFEQLVAYARTQVGDGGAPGASIAVVLDGRLAFATGVGVKRLGESDAVGANTLYRIGSISKMLAAAALLSLTETDGLDVTQPITRYAPDFALAPPFDASTIRVEHLLSHSAGLPDTLEFNCADSVTMDAWAAAHPQPLWAPPGAVWDYSNFGFTLVGMVASHVARQPFRDLVRARVFERAGMATATYDGAAADRADHATGHSFDPTTMTLASQIEPGDQGCSVLDPPGGVVASAVDLAHFAEVLIANGRGMLRPESVARMLDASAPGHVPTRGFPGQVYGAGMFVQRSSGVVLDWHAGGMTGYVSQMYMVPSQGFAVVVLTNSDAHPAAYQIAGRAFSLFVHTMGTGPAVEHTPPASWAQYAGTYRDPFGMLGTLTFSVGTGSDGMPALLYQVDGPAATMVPGGALPPRGALTQVSGDAWMLTPYVAGTFFPDDTGAPARFVTRAGVAARVVH